MKIWHSAYLIALALLFGWHIIDKSRAVDKALSDLNTRYQAQLSLEVIKAKQIETSLLQSAILGIQKKDEEIKNIDTQLNAAISELQQRPKRSTINSQSPSTPLTCTGRELYREDAEFLTREAARAEKLIKERDFYYDEYERARKALTN